MRQKDPTTNDWVQASGKVLKEMKLEKKQKNQKRDIVVKNVKLQFRKQYIRADSVVQVEF